MICLRIARIEKQTEVILESLSMTLRQTANGKYYLCFSILFMLSLKLINRTKIETFFLLFTANTNILILLYRELKTDGKSFIFAVCRKRQA